MHQFLVCKTKIHEKQKLLTLKNTPQIIINYKLRCNKTQNLMHAISYEELKMSRKNKPLKLHYYMSEMLNNNNIFDLIYYRWKINRIEMNIMTGVNQLPTNLAVNSVITSNYVCVLLCHSEEKAGTATPSLSIDFFDLKFLNGNAGHERIYIQLKTGIAFLVPITQNLNASFLATIS